MERKKIILKEIQLSNWRGMNHNVKFNEDSTKISGRNGVGKSSIMKAYLWALTGWGHYSEPKNYNLFDNRVELSQDTPQASVKITINVGGYDTTIERIAEAKFVRKRGSNTYEKASSDTYTIKLDEIETTLSDYNAWIENNICPIEMLPYCLDGGFFIELLDVEKDKARNILEKIIGEIKEEDMKGDYSILKEDMARFSIDMIEERCKNEVKPLKKRLDEIPAIIADKEKTLSEYEAIDFNAILNDIAKTNSDIEDIDSAILGQGKAIEPILGERNRILNIINDRMVEIQKTKNAYLSKETSKINEVKRALQDIKKTNDEIVKKNEERKKEYQKAIVSLNALKVNYNRAQEARENLLKSKNEIKERVFQDDHCAYCGQELPMDKLEEARAKFNAKKQEEYNAVISVGKTNSELINQLKVDIATKQAIIDNGYGVEELKDAATLEVELASLQASFIPFENTDEYATLSAKIKDLEATLPTIPTNDTSALTAAKVVLMTQLEGLNRRYGLKMKADEIREGIARLKNETKEVGIAIAALEGKIDKCKEYRQEKADIVAYRANDGLNECHIDMYSIQKDGTMKGDVVLRGKDNTKYNSLNFSNQIKVRIELQEWFMRNNNGAQLPIFVDESACFDSFNKPIISGQSIFLYASDSSILIVE